jgi:pSer/pThr/pTyr-binding forkhead associated (FHA) protein
MELMAKIRVLEGPMSGAEFELEKEVIFVGRSPGNDVRIDDHTVSKKHLKIFSVESCYFIEDLKTKNGTVINGEPLDAGFTRLITENDRIQLGSTVIRLDGIGLHTSPITVEEIGPHPSTRAHGPESSKAYSGEERRSRAFKEMNFIYDLLQLMGETSDSKQILERVTECLFEGYPRIDKVSAFFLNERQNKMEEIVSRSKQESEQQEASYTRALLDQVVQDGKIVTVFLKADAARDGFTNVQDTVALMAVICLPLMIGGKVRGSIYIEGFRESNPLREEDFLLLKTIKRLLEMSLEKGNPGKRR